ncbi:sortase [Rubrobacter tropicus]|uniref:Sortase n=1 Tax=Rubrobacter tropicus TaxID=2653851 RepID=A0A6G8Q5S3_9ACTN|nr:sortase [Rubrobacter tropicus]QIN81788.1 sortase [Rubrobacter tropicus]
MHLRTGITAMVFALVCAVAVAAFALLGGTPEPAAAVKSATQREAEPLKRSNPGVEPQKERVVDLPEPEEPKPEPKPAPPPEPDPSPKPEPVPPPDREPRPDETPDPRPEADPEPLPDVQAEPPKPTAEDVASAHRERHYDLPDGAVLGLTVKALGIHDVPVFDSVAERALASGVGHHPETSMPWTDEPQRNVYLAGHKLGFPGTASHLIFYRLGELGSGDEILLKDRDGKKYRYEVSESFEADPGDSWAMGQVRNRDMVTLQTCTGPGFSKRLIVRADRQ